MSKIEPFCPQGVPLSQVHKTGLGSSAALITSLVSSLLLHLEVIPSSAFEDVTSEGRHLAHNVAQFVHCLAQGKVGSGFDVSSAVFGSHIYTRFDPAVLKDLMSEETVNELPPWNLYLNATVILTLAFFVRPSLLTWGDGF